MRDLLLRFALRVLRRRGLVAVDRRNLLLARAKAARLLGHVARSWHLFGRAYHIGKAARMHAADIAALLTVNTNLET